jgi:predicted alpha-1,6-mannanase (GH76 family)
MRLVRFLMNNPGKALFFLIMSLNLVFCAQPARAVPPSEADAAFEALNTVYWDPTTQFFRKEEQGIRKADFWFSAQLWDTVMDQYDRTGREDVKRQINEIYDGFIKEYPDWTTNKYNDDIMWWAIACTRAYKMTQDQRYLKKAKESFDFVYDNFRDDTFGGGLYWINQRTSKNSCLNCPAVIAAVRLSVLLKDRTYLDKAKSLYEWQKKTLTDGTGKVFDSIRYNRDNQTVRIGRFSLTYNQGTFIGAGVLLYQQTGDKTYLDDALKAAEWTLANLCVTDEFILRNEGQGDAGAFKGIFARYMKLLIQECGRTEFLPWMRANADIAWRNRRPTDNIMGNDWTAPAGSSIQSQTAASAVAVVLCFVDESPSKKTDQNP